MPAPSSILLGLLALGGFTIDSALGQGECFQEYECVYKHPKSGVVYDLRPLCAQGSPYVHNEGNTTYNVQICGTSKGRCDPVSYPVEHHTGVGFVFFGEKPPADAVCKDNLGNVVPCTRNCETLGIGIPQISLIDEKKPYEGVILQHYSVPSLPEDPHQCKYNPTTGANYERVLEIYVKCNRQATVKPIITFAGEVPKDSCRFHFVVESVYGCGCVPNW